MKTLRRTIHPEIRVLDEKQGIVEYIASDETIDSYREVIRANGWRFDDFQKNAPFVDSHNYSSIDCLLGKVIDFKVQGRQLVEQVKWAIDVPTAALAIKGFQMTAAGYLKAVSVGFVPVSYVTKWDNDPAPWRDQLNQLGLHEEDGVCCVYTEQQQKELSACVIGANPNAVARAYKAGILNDADLEKFSAMKAERETASATDSPAAVAQARQRAQTALMVEFETLIKKI
jgi:hypothetical protein